MDLVVHSHAVHSSAGHWGGFLFWLFDHEGFGGEDEGGDGGGVLDSGSGDLCGVDDSGFHHVNDFSGDGVEAESVGGSSNLLDDD